MMKKKENFWIRKKYMFEYISCNGRTQLFISSEMNWSNVEMYSIYTYVCRKRKEIKEKLKANPQNGLYTFHLYYSLPFS